MLVLCVRALQALCPNLFSFCSSSSPISLPLTICTEQRASFITKSIKFDSIGTQNQNQFKWYARQLVTTQREFTFISGECNLLHSFCRREPLAPSTAQAHLLPERSLSGDSGSTQTWPCGTTPSQQAHSCKDDTQGTITLTRGDHALQHGQQYWNNNNNGNDKIVGNSHHKGSRNFHMGILFMDQLLLMT